MNDKRFKEIFDPFQGYYHVEDETDVLEDLMKKLALKKSNRPKKKKNMKKISKVPKKVKQVPKKNMKKIEKLINQIQIMKL